MLTLFVILLVLLLTILVAMGAMWWRLRRHLRRSDEALKNALSGIQPEHQPAGKTNGSRRRKI